jgi:valyl-tRNA synthetase
VLGSVGAADPNPVAIVEPVDCALMGRLATVIVRATDAFESYDYTTALEVVEKFFWEFCDDYLELVKERAYSEEGGSPTDSARATLAVALHTQLRLLAPFLPYVTEEVWSWWQDGSVHVASWPEALELGASAATDGSMIDHVASALTGVRGAKSQAKVSMRAQVSRVEFRGSEEALAAVERAQEDLRKAGKIIGEIVFTRDPEATELQTAVELAPEA